MIITAPPNCWTLTSDFREVRARTVPTIWLTLAFTCSIGVGYTRVLLSLFIQMLMPNDGLESAGLMGFSARKVTSCFLPSRRMVSVAGSLVALVMEDSASVTAPTE